MIKTIKYIIFFIKESPKFMNKSLIQLILHEHFFRTMKYYINQMKEWDNISNKYGSQEAYLRMNRVIEW